MSGEYSIPRSDQNSRKLKLFIGSWNVGNAPPENLEYLLPSFKSKEKNYYDLIVLGLQESTYQLSPEEIKAIPKLKNEKSLAFAEKHSDPCILHLIVILMNILGPDYEIVDHNRRAQMQLFVIAKIQMHPFIWNVGKNAENTGFMHIFPNKGGLVVTLNVDGTSLAFVSCHLAAHEGVSKCALRNESIKEILEGVKTRDKRYDILTQFHHVFWMGDLNYRLTFSKDTPNDKAQTSSRSSSVKSGSGSQPSTPRKAQDSNNSAFRSLEDELDIDYDALTGPESPDGNDDDESDDEGEEKVINHDPSFKTSISIRKKKHKHRAIEMNALYKLIIEENWEELLKLDELNRELEAGRILRGFTALQPSFPPTFKRSRHACIELRNEADDRTYDIEYRDWSPKKSHVEDAFEDPVPELPNSITKYYDRKRLPSFCDRILYKSWDTYASCITNVFFESCEKVDSSDHKPVRAFFELQTVGGLKDILVFGEEKRSFRSKLGHESHSGRGHRGHSGKSSNAFGVSGGSAHGSADVRSLAHAKYGHSVIHNLAAPDETYAHIESAIDSFQSKVISRLKFEFFNLRGEDLAEMDSQLSGGGSDPYITISADPFALGHNPKSGHAGSMFSSCTCVSNAATSHEITSSVITHNINPVWEDILHMHVLSYDIEELKTNFTFCIAVWDCDTFNDDDLIGTCSISFQDVVEGISGASERYKFERTLFKSGLEMGVLKGTIRLLDKPIEYYEAENSILHVAATISEENGSLSTTVHRRSGANRQSSSASAVSGMSSSPRDSERSRRSEPQGGSSCAVM